MSAHERTCSACGETHTNWSTRGITHRLKLAAAVSMEVGPCPECNYVWKADPRASSAACPRCSEGHQTTDDAPRVPVPDRHSQWRCGECGSIRGGRD